MNNIVSILKDIRKADDFETDPCADGTDLATLAALISCRSRLG
jgi:hypothetical protein